jgi:hypothetical protein
VAKELAAGVKQQRVDAKAAAAEATAVVEAAAVADAKVAAAADEAAVAEAALTTEEKAARAAAEAEARDEKMLLWAALRVQANFRGYQVNG